MIRREIGFDAAFSKFPTAPRRWAAKSLLRLLTVRNHLNRLNTETLTGLNGGKGSGSMTWTYDAFGNRFKQAVASSPTPTFTFGVTQTNNTYSGASLQNGTLMSGVYSNQTDGMNYDLPGNLLNNGTMTFTYDAASRIRTAGTTCYVYNAEGIRTAKGTWVSGICGNITNQYLLGQGSEQVAEFSGIPTGTSNPVSWLHSNVYDGGHLVATYDPNGLHFHFTDWLGTNRVQMNANSTIEETCLSMPFGDSLSCSGTGTDATEHHFTGKEHDNESGLDYFGARYYGSNMGRWMSPDWAAKAEPIPYAKMDDPQSLNLYEYVGNNPLNRDDPDGHLEAQWHFGITFVAAIANGRGVVGSLKLAGQTTGVDFRKGSQGTDAEHTNWHAMRGRKGVKLQTKAEADEGTAKVISDAEKKGDVALALHAVQDQATPLHEGHEWTGLNIKFIAHFFGDNFPSPKTVSKAYHNSVSVLQAVDPDKKTKEAHPNVKDHDFPRESPVKSNQN